jgi:transposase InsO family protein
MAVMKNNHSADRNWAEPRVLGRYEAVRYLEEAVQGGLSLNQSLIAASERPWNGKYYSVPTLERWHYAYRSGGFKALMVETRSDKDESRTFSPETSEVLARLRRQHPKMCATTLLRHMETEGIVSPCGASLSSLYRELHRLGLDRKTLRAGGGLVAGAGPQKAFVMSWSNELWMTDAMHGPFLSAPGQKPQRVFLLALLDDCSRLCAHGQYYPAEQLIHFLDVFKHALRSRGIPEALYADNGKIFTSLHLKTVCANLGVRLLHTKPYSAWSKGKIERFFLTVQQDFEQRLAFKPAQTLAELNQRFWQWLEGEYHQRAHSGLDGKSPSTRFAERAAHLKTLSEDLDLERLFLDRVARRVRRDATIALSGRVWEVSPALRGQVVDVRYDPFGFQRVEIYLNDKKVGDAKICNHENNAHTFRNENYEQC